MKKLLGDKRLLYLAATLFALALMYRANEDISRYNFKDFRSYLKGGAAVLSETSLYFGQTEPSFRYSPFFALLMVPFAAIDSRIAYGLWIAIMITQLFLIIRWTRELIDRRTGSDDPPSLWLYLPALLLAINFTVTNMDKGQANIFVLFWTLAAFRLLERNKTAAAGFCLATGILAKMSPLLFLPYFVIRKKFKFVFWCGLATVILSLIPFLVQGIEKGTQAFMEWLYFTRAAHDPYFLANQSNQSLIGAVSRLFIRQTTPSMIENGNGVFVVSPLTVKAVYAALSTLLYGAFLFKPSDRLNEPAYGLNATGIDLIGMIVAITIIFPVGWKYCLVGFLTGAITLFLYLSRTRGGDRTVLLLLFGFVLFGTLLPSIPDSFTRVQIHFHSSVTWGSLFLAAALWRIKHVPLPLGEVHAGKVLAESRSR